MNFYDKNLAFRSAYFILTALLFIPLFTLTYIVSHDGPSHIYNSGIIRQLLSGDSPAVDFLFLKSFPEPNWIGHFILLLLGNFFSPAIADKIFLGSYIFFFPFFTYILVNRINPRFNSPAFLAIPFVYSIFLFLGVYNFLAGITILLWAISSVIPRISSEGKSLYYRLFIFSVLLYFSHLLALGVFLIVVLVAFLFSWFETKEIRRNKFITHSVFSVLAFLPVLILTLLFFIKKISIPAKESGVTIQEMLDFLWHIRFMITLTYSPEDIYAIVLFGLFCSLLLIWILIKFSSNDGRRLPFYQRYEFWLVNTLLMLACYFIIPDEAASGGVVKFRFLLLFYLFLIAFLSVIDYPLIVNLFVVILISGWTVLKLDYLYPMMKQLNNDAVLLMNITEPVKPNSVLLPLNYSGNWLHDNLSNYAGTRNHIFILDNYEANTPHFPAEWKEGKSPIKIMGIFSGAPPLCADMKKFEEVTKRKIDYVLLWHQQKLDDSCSATINQQLENMFTVVKKEGDVFLYERK